MPAKNKRTKQTIQKNWYSVKNFKVDKEQNELSEALQDQLN